MRALVFRGAWDIGVEDRPDPRPGADEVLIRITATGICGSDIHGFTGENGRRHPGQVMGHETVGRVVSGPAERVVRRRVQPAVGQGGAADPALAGVVEHDVEHDLDAEGRLVPVDREPGLNTANVVVAQHIAGTDDNQHQLGGKRGPDGYVIVPDRMQKQNGQFQAIPNWPGSGFSRPSLSRIATIVPVKSVFSDQQSWTSVTANPHASKKNPIITGTFVIPNVC